MERGDPTTVEVEFPTNDGARVYVRALDEQATKNVSGGLARAGAGERVLRTAARTWEQSLDGMRAAAAGALSQLRKIDPAPDEIRVSFRVAVNGKVGATLVSGGADAHLNVEVVWKSDRPVTKQPTG